MGFPHYPKASERSPNILNDMSNAYLFKYFLPFLTTIPL
ncbi:unknown [Prevotella sp. CAG:732]|nr:unknown [Prevotella sp. CAG:732]